MKKKHKPNILALLFLLCVNKLIAQDIFFSQWQNARTFVNPALAGKDSGVFVNTTYRNQWPGLSGNFVTYYAGADAYIKKINTGIGFNYVNNNAGRGTIKTDHYSMQLSPKFTLKNKLKVSIGFEAAYVQTEINTSKFSFASTVNSNIGFGLPSNTIFINTKTHYFDYNGSILIDNKLGNIGFVYSHILQPNQSYNKLSESPLQSKFTLHATTKKIILSSTNPLKLKIGLLAMRQANYNFIMVSATMSYKAFEVLTGFRRNDIIVGAGIQPKHFRLFYSFDINISKLNNTQGSHELTMAYLLY